MKNKSTQYWRRFRGVDEMASESNNDIKILAFLCWK